MTHPKQCTAKTKRTGKQCRAYAVNNTDKCRIHGGMTPVKHGLYSKYTRTRLADRIEELRTDPLLVDLREHIAAITALTFEQLNQAGDNIDQETAANLSTLLDRLTKAIVRHHEVTFGKRYVLQVESVQALVLQVVHVIEQEVSDPATIDRIGKRLQSLQIREG